MRKEMKIKRATPPMLPWKTTAGLKKKQDNDEKNDDDGDVCTNW